MQVRHGDPLDRRHSSRPHWRAEKQLAIYALGRARVESREGPIGGAWLEHRPGQLLKYLVCERHRVVSVEEIAGAIWPHADRRALGLVRHYVHELRDRLEPDRSKRVPSAFVVARQGGYTLDRGRVRIDADDFEAAVKEGTSLFANGDTAGAAVSLERAIALYRGDLFAEDPYEVWAIDERDRLREMAAGVLRLLAELLQQSGDFDPAHEHLKRLGEMEPFDMEVQRRLIQSCLRRGRRSEAARRLFSLRMRMLHAFGEELGFDLVDLQETLEP